MNNPSTGPQQPPEHGIESSPYNDSSDSGEDNAAVADSNPHHRPGYSKGFSPDNYSSGSGDVDVLVVGTADSDKEYTAAHKCNENGEDDQHSDTSSEQWETAEETLRRNDDEVKYHAPE